MVAERLKRARELRNEAWGEVEAKATERKAVGETGEGCINAAEAMRGVKDRARADGEISQGKEMLFSLNFASGGNS